MFCPKCGLQLPEGTNFCPRCGTKLSQSPGDPANTSAPQNQESVSDGVVKGCGAYILAIMIIVIVVIIALSVRQ